MSSNATAHFAIGINLDGVLDHDGLPVLDADQRFDRVAAAGVFDYVEINPQPQDDFAPFLRASERTGVPIGVMGGIFCVGPETLGIYQQLNRQAGELGCRLFNCQVFARDSASATMTLDDFGSFYMALMELGARHGCLPALEIHVDMWLEQFHRVGQLGDWLARRDVPLRLTLDHSHLLFKMGNPAELAESGLASEADLGHALLHPSSPANFYTGWLERGWVVHSHARSVQVNGVPNPLTRRGQQLGRGIQYPFVAPPPGSYHQAWQEAQLAPWKLAVEQLLSWKKAHPASPLAQISCEFIPYPDYGGAARYSIMEQNVACAEWLRGRVRALDL